MDEPLFDSTFSPAWGALFGLLESQPLAYATKFPDARDLMGPMCAPSSDTFNDPDSLQGEVVPFLSTRAVASCYGEQNNMFMPPSATKSPTPLSPFFPTQDALDTPASDAYASSTSPLSTTSEDLSKFSGTPVTSPPPRRPMGDIHVWAKMVHVEAQMSLPPPVPAAPSSIPQSHNKRGGKQLQNASKRQKHGPKTAAPRKRPSGPCPYCGKTKVYSRLDVNHIKRHLEKCAKYPGDKAPLRKKIAQEDNYRRAKQQTKKQNAQPQTLETSGSFPPKLHTATRSLSNQISDAANQPMECQTGSAEARPPSPSIPQVVPSQTSYSYPPLHHPIPINRYGAVYHNRSMVPALPAQNAADRMMPSVPVNRGQPSFTFCYPLHNPQPMGIPESYPFTYC